MTRASSAAARPAYGNHCLIDTLERRVLLAAFATGAAAPHGAGDLMAGTAVHDSSPLVGPWVGPKPLPAPEPPIAIPSPLPSPAPLPTAPAAAIVVRPPGNVPGSGLFAEYFDNIDFTGTPLRRVDPTVNFAWDTASPDPSLGPERFSVRWSGRVQPRFSETYTFYTVTDDGVRLWVNGRLLIDNFTDHPPTENRGTIALQAGRKYDIRIEYYENTVGATARLSWSSRSQRKEVIPAGRLDPAIDRVRRTGRVRLSGRAIVDDQGAFNGLGATLMWGTWAYKNDRPRLEQALHTLSRQGFDYVRVLGVVGDPGAPDFWDGRESDWRIPDYAQVIAGLTDLAYDTYGLRVEWTLIGDGQKIIPNATDRFALVDRFLAMAQGRSHKIMHFEIANEAWQNGFDGAAGEQQLRDLTAYMNQRTDILVAASAGFDAEQMTRIYQGGVADIATNHFDRNVSTVEGHWRPVRQPWEHQFTAGLPTGSNNEPIGPGSSVNSETDPLKLVTGAIVTHVAGLPMYVFHSNAGVRGDQDIAGMPGVASFRHLRALLPTNLSGWTPKNAHWADSPFRVYARDANGTMHPDTMWVDWPGNSTGAVRAYGAVSGNNFVVAPIGVRGPLTMEPRRRATFDVIDPMSGVLLQTLTLNAGQQFTLAGKEAYFIRGRYL